MKPPSDMSCDGSGTPFEYILATHRYPLATFDTEISAQVVVGGSHRVGNCTPTILSDCLGSMGTNVISV